MPEVTIEYTQQHKATYGLYRVAEGYDTYPDDWNLVLLVLPSTTPDQKEAIVTALMQNDLKQGLTQGLYAWGASLNEHFLRQDVTDLPSKLKRRLLWEG